jgi:hypothetical protein
LLAEIDRSGFTSFLNDLREVGRKNGHPEARIKLAEFRVIEPLVVAPEAFYVERTWNEFSDEERKKYLRHATERETILLRRPNELRRVQEYEHLSQRQFAAAKGDWKVRPTRLASDALETEMRAPANLRRLGLLPEPKKAGRRS